jgi:hypothetical protein
VQKVRPVIGIDRPVHLKMMLPCQRRCYGEHRHPFGFGVDRHDYGPVPTSPLVAVVASSETVAFWSTTAPASL